MKDQRTLQTEGDIFVKVLRLERFGGVRGNKRKKKKRLCDWGQRRKK